MKHVIVWNFVFVINWRFSVFFEDGPSGCECFLCIWIYVILVVSDTLFEWWTHWEQNMWSLEKLNHETVFTWKISIIHFSKMLFRFSITSLSQSTFSCLSKIIRFIMSSCFRNRMSDILISSLYHLQCKVLCDYFVTVSCFFHQNENNCILIAL